MAASVAALLVGPAQAVTFIAPLDDTRWELEASKFSCRLSQPIPDFGTASFEHRAGEQLEFVISSPQAELLGKETLIMAEAPPWHPGRGTHRIGMIRDAVNSKSFRLQPPLAKDILTSLYQGRTPALTNQNWYGTDTAVKVAISSANFQQAYSNYQSCVGELLPVNFQQVARSAVLFPSAQWRLSDSTRQRLDLVALYVKNDPSVKTIYVDGHSDNLGRRLANRDLSRQRAEAVTRYLTKIGINEDMITTRYHGERYPVVKNTNSNNRARNRRVTVRLEREG
ncbi:OmpA family protein [Motiliproteus coralliicola]|uniref:OmpA family protein n=1 Tax=Motiliproteus coralliicola TaxID=2283196 RepID=A0A369WUM3_9GAMM|nr:OmpA family protein [Motiliproteus coralliicola]RDE25347.1 OmpA family protein [Motiliproteus coralliicola]